MIARRAALQLVAVAGAACGQIRRPPGKTPMTTDSLLIEYAIGLRAGHRVERPRQGASREILRGVAEANDAARLQGLPDEFNPGMIAPDKAEAFLAGLPRVPLERWRTLRGRILYLSDPALGLQAAGAITAAILGHGFDLEVRGAGEAGSIAAVQVVAAPDIALARTRMAGAKAQLARFAGEVKALEAREARGEAKGKSGSELLRALSLARSSRYAAATVWRMMAETIAAASPNDLEARREAETARAEAARLIQPPTTGMPR